MSLNSAARFDQNYPDKPVRIITNTPGGPADSIMRLLAQEIAGPLGQPVMVDTRPSALTGAMLAKAAPDGYTMGALAGSTWLTPLVQKTDYDVIRDFVPITALLTYPHFLAVNPSVPAHSLNELISLAKSKPGLLKIAVSASPGGHSYLEAELFKAMACIDIVRVPFVGNPTALLSLLAGETQLLFNDWGQLGPHVNAGRLRVLAATTLEPSPHAPRLPTLSASGLSGYESVCVVGMLAPAGTPAPIIKRLNQEIVPVLNRPDVRDKFFKIGIDVAPSSPEQFAAKIKSEIIHWSKVLKDAGMRP